jgi:hypothetical protein
MSQAMLLIRRSAFLQIDLLVYTDFRTQMTMSLRHNSTDIKSQNLFLDSSASQPAHSEVFLIELSTDAFS